MGIVVMALSLVLWVVFANDLGDWGSISGRDTKDSKNGTR